MKITPIIFADSSEPDYYRIESVISHSFSSVSGVKTSPKVFSEISQGMPAIAGALKDSAIIAVFASDSVYLEAKRAVCKAFKFEMVHSESILERLRANEGFERYMMHAAVPKNATPFPLSDGMYSGFAIRSKRQCIFFLPFSQDRTFITMKKYVFPYITRVFGDILPSFKEYELAYAAAVLARQIEDTDIQIAVANTSAAKYIAHTCKKDDCFRSHVSYAPFDEKAVNKRGIQSAAVSAAQYYECRFGAAVIEGEKDDSGEYTATIVISNGKTATVRSIASIADESHDDFMFTVATELFLMLAHEIHYAPELTKQEMRAIKPTSVMSGARLFIMLLLFAVTFFLTYVMTSFSNFTLFD